MKKTGVIFLFLFLASGSCPGANFAYLNNPAGARAVGLAESFTALPGDVFSMYYNPASVVNLKQTTIGLTHVEFIQGTRYEYAAIVFPVSRTAAGFSIIYINNGVQERRDLDGVVTGEFTPYQVVPQATIAVEAVDGFSLGLNLKVPYEVIDDYLNYKPLFDIGANIKVIERIYAGVNAQNIGTSENLPTNFKAGLAYMGEKINFCIDYNAPIQAVSTVSIGFEAKTLGMFTLRAGYKSKLGSPINAENGISAGFGARFDIINVDYGYKTYGELGGTHFVSLTMGIK
ncbi:MAG: PorV/PorQ family protein [Candidatus Firestonebacteria bacterium]